MNESFTEFRSIYPRQADETQTWLAWNKAIFGGAKPSDILEGARLFADYAEVTQMQTQYIPLPWNWLNSKRWLERLTPKPKFKDLPKPSQARWSQYWQDKPINSKPIAVQPLEAIEQPKPFRSAKEILEAHGRR